MILALFFLKVTKIVTKSLLNGMNLSGYIYSFKKINVYKSKSFIPYRKWKTSSFYFIMIILSKEKGVTNFLFTPLVFSKDELIIINIHYFYFL
jgi:hypothetical protein